jgi:hypothetical protein
MEEAGQAVDQTIRNNPWIMATSTLNSIEAFPGQVENAFNYSPSSLDQSRINQTLQLSAQNDPAMNPNTPGGTMALGVESLLTNSGFFAANNQPFLQNTQSGLSTLSLAGGVTLEANAAYRTAFAPLESSVAPTASLSIKWGPLNGPGPLSDSVLSTFQGGTYTQTVLSQETTLYRVYGGTAGSLGGYWTRTPPSGPLQATIDSALNPTWGNTAQSVSVIKVPVGSTIYEGAAAPQGGLVGGGNQVYIPKVNPNWLVTPSP